MKITAFRWRDRKKFIFQIYTIYPIPYWTTVNGVDIAYRVPALQSSGWSIAVAVKLHLALLRMQIDHFSHRFQRYAQIYIVLTTLMLFIEENRLMTIDATKRSDPTVDIESNAKPGLHDRVISNGLWSSPLLHHYTCSLFITDDI